MNFYFDSEQQRKKIRYLVVTDAYSDINRAYGFQSKEDLDSFMKGGRHPLQVRAVFKAEDITPPLNNQQSES